MNYDFKKHLISDDNSAFSYKSFWNDFKNDYAIDKELEVRSKQISEAIRRLKENYENSKRFEFDFTVTFPNQENVLQSVVSENNEHKKPSEILEHFFTLNYPGLYYDEILDTQFFKKNGTVTELDTESMFLRIADEDLKVNEKFINRFLKSPERVHYYNPIKDYFNSLTKHDGQDHVKRFVSLFDIREHVQGVNMAEFTTTMLRKYFVRTLTQLFEKGMRNINKLSICLFSPKGSGKTTFVKEKMFPPKLVSELEDNTFFTDSFNIDFKDNNSKETMCSNWIVFTDEFNFFANQKHNVSRKELNDFKKYSGNSTFDVIKHGDKKTGKRIASFIFCLNPDTFHGIPVESLVNRFFILDFLNGQGNTLPFDKWQDIDILKMWSQIYSLYKSGYNAQLTKEEEKTLETINDKYLMHKNGDLTALIETYIKVDKNGNGKGVTSSELLKIMLDSGKVPEHIKIELKNMGNVGLGRRLTSILRRNTPDFKKVTDHSKASKTAYRLIIDF